MIDLVRHATRNVLTMIASLANLSAAAILLVRRLASLSLYLNRETPANNGTFD